MWLILADDLTGAADCAIAFARRGHVAVVGWEQAEASVPVFAYDAASRELTAGATLIRHRQVLARLAVGRRVFVKIDSTLRGQPAAAIAAALTPPNGANAVGVLAPAFPATGRTIERGRVRVDGGPLEETELWRRDHSYPTADLTALVAGSGLAGHRVPLATIRSGALCASLRAIPPGEVAICDALEQADLVRLVRAAPANACFIGSAGLAHALADSLPGGTAWMPPWSSSHGTLVVVGSLARVSRDAARQLAELDGVRHWFVTPDAVDPGLVDAVATTLGNGGDVLLAVEAPDAVAVPTRGWISPRVVASVAGALAPAAARIGALVATGGETAAALLHAFGIHGIRLYEEPEPGVSVGLTMGAIEVPLATKAGGFGDRETLVRIVRRLRHARQQGTSG